MLQILSPYDRRLIKELPLAGEQEAESALNKAHALFENRQVWLPAYERIGILNRAVEIMKGRVEELTNMAAEEGGKPYTDSRVEVIRAINSVQLAAEHISHLNGEQIPMSLNKASVNRIAFTMREPIGVVFSICAFNHPLNLVVHQTATAIAAGCPVIIKPASTTPLSCINFAGILKEAGLPDGWCQVLVCENEVAERLLSSERIHFLSFIGSAKVGWYLRSKLAPGTRCSLEHGGAAPVIVEKDAEVESMLPLLIKGGFYHAGQVCVSVQRVFVHEDLYESVAFRLTEMAKKLVTGDPMDPKTEVGPLITPNEVNRVEEWVNEAVAGGAAVLCGGKRISDTCYEPTILAEPPADAKVSVLEIFGPVVCLYRFKDRDKAIAAANSLNVHFQAAVFTRDLDTALDCVKKLNATAVMVNDHTAFRVDWMPFGGRDASGLGMGGISYTMQEMTREKLMVIKSHML